MATLAWVRMAISYTSIVLHGYMVLIKYRKCVVNDIECNDITT